MKKPAKYTVPDYPVKTTRLMRKFAWKPIYISGTVIWLEFYDVLQVYEGTNHETIMDGEQVDFMVFTWVNLTNRCR